MVSCRSFHLSTFPLLVLRDLFLFFPLLSWANPSSNEGTTAGLKNIRFFGVTFGWVPLLRHWLVAGMLRMGDLWRSIFSRGHLKCACTFRCCITWGNLGGVACFPLLSQAKCFTNACAWLAQEQEHQIQNLLPKKAAQLVEVFPMVLFSLQLLLLLTVASSTRCQWWGNWAQGHHSALPVLEASEASEALPQFGEKCYEHTEAKIIGMDGKWMIGSKKMVCWWLGVQQNHMDL